LNSHPIIERGLTLGLLRLRFFDAGAEHDECEARPYLRED
jgi:hypothetical protein